jgi:hypothetical protein
MTPTGDDDDLLDPLIAERFRLLEALRPPTDLVGRNGGAARGPAIAPARPRRRAVLAAAAAIVVVAAVSAAALLVRGDGTSGLETVDPADRPGPTDPADDRALLTVDPSSTTTGPGPTAAPEGTGRPGEQPEPDGAGDDGSDADGDGSTTPGGAAAGSTGSTTPPSDPPATSATTRPPGSGGTTTANPPPSAPGVGSTTSSGGPGGDATVTVRGRVTEVFTDCQSHLVLNPQGKVVPRNPVSCDGGSWIEVDGTRVRTSSGFVASGRAFDRHDPGLRPGTMVAVTARSPAGNGPLTLDCPTCGIGPG